jgi:transposase-like protein
VRAIGVTEVTYYRWRQEYGGLKSDQVRRMKALELENQRLRKAVADLTLDKQILGEAARGVKGVPETVRWTVSALNGRSP